MSHKLIETGWILQAGRWNHPQHPDLGTCSEPRALRNQAELERFAQGLPVFELDRCSHGYGYIIYSYQSPKSKPKAIFQHQDVQIAKQALALLNADTQAQMELDSKQQPIQGFFTNFQFPRLLVITEKHGTRYYHVPTPKKLDEVSLALLQQRNQEGYYPTPEQDSITQPELTPAQIEALPDGTIKRQAQAQYSEYQNQINYRKEEEEMANDIKRAMETKNGRLACRILRERAGYEYEGFALEEFSAIEPEQATPSL
jgi:hypothetical protein